MPYIIESFALTADSQELSVPDSVPAHPAAGGDSLLRGGLQHHGRGGGGEAGGKST